MSDIDRLTKEVRALQDEREEDWRLTIEHGLEPDDLWDVYVSSPRWIVHRGVGPTAEAALDALLKAIRAVP